MLWPIVVGLAYAITVLVGVDTSRAFWDNRHYTDVVRVSAALENQRLVDHSFILIASDPARSWLNLGANLTPIDPGLIAPHELTPKRFLRFLLEDMWRELHTTFIDTLVIYFAGHGSPGFIRFQDSQLLYKRNLEKVLRALKQAGRFTNVCIIVDSCHAASFIDILKGADWYVGISSSMEHESSYSVSTNPVTGVPYIDRFSLALTSINLTTFDRFVDLLSAKAFNYNDLLSHPTIFGNGDLWFKKL